MFDRTEWGGRLNQLPVIDEFTRECLSLEVERSFTSSDVIETLDRLVEEYGIPDFIRSDNGPEFVARAVKDWIAARGFRTLFIEPGSLWQNCFIESFNARFRDEFLNVESFTSLLESKVLSAEHRDRYNHHRPHSSLGDLTPAEFAAAYLNPPGCSQAPFASDELRTHSRRPEPGNSPATPGLAKRVPIPNPEAGKPDQPEPEESTHNEKLSEEVDQLPGALQSCRCSYFILKAKSIHACSTASCLPDSSKMYSIQAQTASAYEGIGSSMGRLSSVRKHSRTLSGADSSQ